MSRWVVWIRCWMPVLFVVGGSIGVAVAEQQSVQLPPPVVSPERALANQYCLACHNPTAKTAGLDLDTISSHGVSRQPEVWEKVIRKLRARHMPPVGMPRPEESTYNAVVSSLETSLDRAAAEGHEEVVDALIRAGADFRAPLDSGFTPLLFALREGRAGVVRVLLEAGAEVNETTQPSERRGGYKGRPRAGTSALLMAVANAHYELAAYLLNAGADPNADLPGYTVLHAIASVRKPGVGDNNPPPEGSGNMNSIELVRKLAAHGANLNARMTKKVNFGNTRLNKLAATPFFLAAHAGDAELMRALAALGADPLLPNAENSTPLMAATGLGTRSPGEDAGTEPEVLEAVLAALELGADIDAIDDNGETAMHGAAYKNLPKVVELLAEKGAKIEIWNQKNKQGWTPLTIAEGHRFGNFKPSPVTVAAFHRVMSAAGVSTAGESHPAPGAGRKSY